MLRITNYVRAQSLQEAYDLYQKKNNVILGGMLWLKMQNNAVNTAIDLSDLGLDTIEETPEEYRIGAMVSLRALEQHPGLAELTCGAMAEALRHIVGVQFRNTATVGGSIYGRFGFSDVLTIFQVLDARVELFGRGVMALSDFAEMSRAERDVLVRILVPKKPRKVAYLSQRNTQTDFPSLTCAVSLCEGKAICAIGARPGRAAVIADEEILKNGISEASVAKFAEYITENVEFDNNNRASAAYRKKICPVLVRRALDQLQEV